MSVTADVLAVFGDELDDFFTDVATVSTRAASGAAGGTAVKTDLACRLDSVGLALQGASGAAERTALASRRQFYWRRYELPAGAQVSVNGSAERWGVVAGTVTPFPTGASQTDAVYCRADLIKTGGA